MLVTRGLCTDFVGTWCNGSQSSMFALLWISDEFGRVRIDGGEERLIPICATAVDVDAVAFF